MSSPNCPFPVTTLRTDRLILRSAHSSDAADLFYKCFSDPEVTQYAMPHESIQDTEFWVEDMMKTPFNGTTDFLIVLQTPHGDSQKDRDSQNVSADVPGTLPSRNTRTRAQQKAADASRRAREAADTAGMPVIGKIGIWRCDFSAKPLVGEIGFFLAREYWRRGIITEAAGEALEYYFETLGFETITADIDPRNLPSLECMKKLGFVETGSAEETIQVGDEWCHSLYLGLDKKQWEENRSRRLSQS